MSKPKKRKPISGRKKEGNMYDKILKENLLELFIPFLQRILNFKAKKITPLPEKLQTTLEFEVDGLLLIEPEEGDKFILHLEFQTTNDANMIYRTGEYHGIVLKNYQLPIKHILIYFGEAKLTMKSKVPESQVFTGIEIIDFKKLEIEQFLTSQIPAEIIMTILADYPIEKVETVLKLIVRNLRQNCKTEKDFIKYCKQLIIISRLRKFESLTNEIVHQMPISFDIDIENDYFYKLGAKNLKELEAKLDAFKIEKNKIEQEKEKAENEANEAKLMNLNNAKELLKLNVIPAIQIQKMFKLSKKEMTEIEKAIKKETKDKK